MVSRTGVQEGLQWSHWAACSSEAPRPPCAPRCLPPLPLPDTCGSWLGYDSSPIFRTCSSYCQEKPAQGATCMSVEERPGFACRSVHRPCVCAFSPGSARFVPPDTTCSDYSGELSPSFCTVTSERISDAQSAFMNTADVGGADTSSSLRP